MTPFDYCQQKCAESGSSFYFSFQFLSPPQRRAMMALYAFCREVDDIVDSDLEPSIAAIKLAWWKNEIAAIGHGKAQHLVARALQTVSRDAPQTSESATERYNLPLEWFEEIIDGMTMDLQQSRYQDFKALQLYCFRVAGVVGLLSAEIFGYQSRPTSKYAETLGIALQLTNIIRDVGEDADRQRIYLPQDEFQQFKVDEQQIFTKQYTAEFQQLMLFQYERAESFYQRAYQLLAKEDQRSQRPGLLMAAIYRALLAKIHKSSFPVLNQRVQLTAIEKLAQVGKTLWRFR